VSGAIISNLIVIALVLSLPLQTSAARPLESAGLLGELWSYGEIELNGDPAVSGTTLFSNSLITTTSSSTAVISIAKVGRVEILPRSSVQIGFNNRDLECKLNSGTIRVSTTAGVTSVVTTRDGRVSGEPNQAAMFSVSVEEKTFFRAYSGSVSAQGGPGVNELAQAGFFRSGLPQPNGATKTTLPANAHAPSLAVVLISLGTLIAAVTGLVSPYNESFFKTGGMPAVDPALYP
jgi:hypothetical protein